MKDIEIKKICDFINDEINPYDLDFEYEIVSDYFYAVFNGHFTSNNEIELTFRFENGNIEIKGLCESFILCETREFWIELMGRICK